MITVTLERGGALPPQYWQHVSDDTARQRAQAIADTTESRVERVWNGYRVDASAYYARSERSARQGVKV